MTFHVPGQPSVEVRDLERRDVAEVIRLLQRERAHFSGSRRKPVFAALLADAQGPRARTAAAVGVRDGAPIAVIVAIAGDAPTYWRSLLWRHPLAFAALAAHRVKKLPARVTRRRRAKATDQGGAGAHVQLDPQLADEPRLQVAPPGPGEPGPRWGEAGPRTALGLYLVVDRDQRGLGVSEYVFRRVLARLREMGMDRYDCSFDPRSVAAIRMHLSMPFVVYRLPVGYVGTVDLHEPALDWPPST